MVKKNRTCLYLYLMQKIGDEMSYYGEVAQVVFLSLFISITSTLIASLSGMI